MGFEFISSEVRFFRLFDNGIGRFIFVLNRIRDIKFVFNEIYFIEKVVYLEY